ncbi:desulfoferrodoxin family protein [Anaerotardibacter muris]|uniref:desulfoferrodoxin family protein n=1 Tax=Anaerotardibacter muris TaxID=2941505 RepID=UPI002041D8AA|nr:desulfoferrodoxin family protein [Anaerotardibacter muris]
MKLQFFKCEHCGNVAVKLFDEGPALFCCGQQMTELVPDSVDASAEKHVPVVEVTDDIKVKIGAEEHPMIDTHWITMIVLETNRGFQYVELQPGDKPEAEFTLAPGENPVAVYDYCNIHGLWVHQM